MSRSAPLHAIDVLRAIDKYHRQFGWWPSTRDLNDALGLKSTSTVNYHLHTLDDLGWLELGGNGMSRAMRITAEGRAVLAVDAIERETAQV